MADDEKTGGVQVIARAAAILEVLGQHSGGLSLGDIAGRVDLPRSTVQRIVAALETANLVRNEGAGGIGLGAGLLRLMSSAHADLVSVAKPALQQLGQATNETVVLSRASGSHLLVEHRIVADRELQVIPRLGLIDMPIQHSSAGRALLALESDDAVRRRIGLSRGTKAEQLSSQLRVIRQQGFACDEGELMEGITTTAVAIDSILGRFAVSLPIPTVRFEKDRDNYLEHLLKCKSTLNKQIGTSNRST